MSQVRKDLWVPKCATTRGPWSVAHSVHIYMLANALKAIQFMLGTVALKYYIFLTHSPIILQNNKKGRKTMLVQGHEGTVLH